jgi:hypothetical protein
LQTLPKLTAISNYAVIAVSGGVESKEFLKHHSDSIDITLLVEEAYNAALRMPSTQVCLAGGVSR